MKVIKLYSIGLPVTKLINKNGLVNKRYTKWLETLKEDYIEIVGTFPTQPIRKAYKTCIEFTFNEMYRKCPSLAMKNLMDGLADIGILYDNSHICHNTYEIKKRNVRKETNWWSMTLWVDDKDPINHRVNWDEWNIVGERKIKLDERSYKLNQARMNKEEKKRLREEHLQRMYG